MESKNYITEDFETLMIQKSFDQLLPEEKSFVLQHVKDQAEYDQLRNLFFQVIEMGQEDDDLIPDPSVKAHLDSLFDGQQKQFTPWYNKPIFWSSISGVAAIFVFAFLWLSNQENSPELLAENHSSKEPQLQQNNQPELGAEKNQNATPPQPEVIQFSYPENEEIVVIHESADEVSMPPVNDAINFPPAEPAVTSTKISEERDLDAVANLSDNNSTVIGTAVYKKGQEALVQDIHHILAKVDGAENKTTVTSTNSVAEKTELSKEKATKKNADGKNREASMTSGKYFLKLKVDANGKLAEVIILRSPNPGSSFDQQLPSLLQKKLGNFQVCEINGKKVSSELVVPVQMDWD